MKTVQQVKGALEYIEESIKNMSPGKKSDLKVVNIKKKLRKSYDDIAKLKDPERQQLMAKLAELRSSLKALLEKWELTIFIPKKVNV